MGHEFPRMPDAPNRTIVGYEGVMTGIGNSMEAVGIGEEEKAVHFGRLQTLLDRA